MSSCGMGRVRGGQAEEAGGEPDDVGIDRGNGLPEGEAQDRRCDVAPYVRDAHQLFGVVGDTALTLPQVTESGKDPVCSVAQPEAGQKVLEPPGIPQVLRRHPREFGVNAGGLFVLGPDQHHLRQQDPQGVPPGLRAPPRPVLPGR